MSNIVPLNITKPCPFVDLQGFQWRGVDAGQDAAGGDDNEAAPADEATFSAQVESLGVDRAEPPRIHRRTVDTKQPQALPDTPQSAAIQAQQKTMTSRQQLDAQTAPVEDNHLDPLLKTFIGAWAGNGFNMIFVPISDNELKPLEKLTDIGPKDNKLIVNLMTEQWTFGPSLGKIPNRGMLKQNPIVLGGLPYLQTVQDVTNELTGKPDKATTDRSGIHFEPGVFLHVPQAHESFHKPADGLNRPSIVRMASIPHGTTINAQGLVPGPNDKTKEPVIKPVDTTPFSLSGGPGNRQLIFHSMDAEKENVLREPANLSKFNSTGTGRITTDIIKDPNTVLRNANKGLKMEETITFQLSTGVGKGQRSVGANLNGGGTTNISFLHGFQGQREKFNVTDKGKTTEKEKVTERFDITTAAPDNLDMPNAHAESMTNQWWIEKVKYDVEVPPLREFETATLWAKMPEVTNPKGEKVPSTAPTPRFAVTAPVGGVPKPVTIQVQGTQLQYSQTVNLNFGLRPGGILTWPHVSVATLVPVAPQPFVMEPSKKL